MTNEELAIEIQQGHTEYISELWDQTEKLFVSHCNSWWAKRGERFSDCGLTPDDLKQECYFILIDAVAAFDSSTGFKFTTYTRFPMQNRFNALLGYRYGHRNLLNHCISLDTPVTEDEDYSLLDAIPDSDSERPYEQIDHADYIARLHKDLEAAMDRKLSEQQKSILLDWYYFRSSFEDIMEKHGISAGRVRTILKTSRSRLRSDPELSKLYGNEILQDLIYKRTGLSYFKNSGMSSVEKSVEILDYKLRKTAYEKHAKPDKEANE